MNYFSDHERGVQPRTVESISPKAWGGIVALVDSLSDDGSFGRAFPERCPDGEAISGTNQRSFRLALEAEVQGIEWPLEVQISEGEGWEYKTVPYAPNVLNVLDFIQFCYLHVSKATQLDYHSYHRHHHLSFDRDSGRSEFRKRINLIFSRNGISFDLQEDGTIIRLAPPVLAELLSQNPLLTDDSLLNQFFEDAKRKFFSPDLHVRKESLEKLWDAWERLKTLHNPSDKKASITALLAHVSPEPQFRNHLTLEANELTSIGNNLMIRHFELNKIPLHSSSQVDYLFHRLFALTKFLMDNRARSF